VLDEQALLIAIPVRHLQSTLDSAGETVVLPAGGPGDLDAAAPGLPVLVMPTDTADTADAEISAATWRATLVRRVLYEPGSPWPAGLPTSWTDEHSPPEQARDDLASAGDHDVDDGEDDDPAWDEDDEVGPQSFLEVADLGPMPRAEWVFANELVGKQARGGRTFRPRVPTLVTLPV
jgi:hypothetical protein